MPRKSVTVDLAKLSPLRGVRADMPRLLVSLPRRLFLVTILAGAALIAWTSLDYFDFSILPAFVIEKMPLRFESLYLTCLRVHVATALPSLPLCLLLTTRALQRRPALHRWLGRITGVLLLFALVPSGIVLSFSAKGGGIVTLGFLLSAAIVACCTVWGIRAARRRELVAHGHAMRHVVAQMSVAVTSRALMIGLDTLGVSPQLGYVLALWVPVLGSAAVVELLSRGSSHLFSKVFRIVERMRRENVPLLLVLRTRSVAHPVPRVSP
jgi:threonine/homoserine/homoserine lactone efflux protein